MATLPPRPRLRGPDAELRALGATLDQAASGRVAVTVVEGEAGAGKTRLLAEVADEARRRGFEVASGRTEELERTRPFGLLADAFACAPGSPDPRRAAIAALLTTRAGERGPLTVTSDPGLQFQAVDAFVDLVEALALDGPLLVGLDDLQWADPSSLLTLGALGRRLTDVPVALVACLRPTPRPPDLERVLAGLDAVQAQRRTLGQLPDQAVAELVAETVGAEPGGRLMAQVAAAGGNPLFVTELVGALVQEGVVRTVDGRAEATRMAMPPTLRHTILRRLGLLPGGVLEVLRAASILGSGFSLAELSTTTGRSALDLSPLLAEALRARVLEDEGGRLRFRHDLIREAVYEDLPASVRLGLHREAGQRLAAAGASTLQVAEHLARGATPGDADAVAWLARAAREAAPRSPAAAAELFERAVGLAAPSDPGRDLLLAEQAGALMWSGRLADAEATSRSLLERDHDPAAEGPARICLARTLLAQGRTPEALEELERARRSPALTDHDRARALGWTGMARLSLADLDGAAAAAGEARAAAAAVGDHAMVSLATVSLTVAEELRGRLGEALRIVDEGVRLADASPGRQGHRYPIHVTRGHVLVELDRLEDARSTLQAGRRLSEGFGVRWPLPSYQVFLGLERFVAGEWDDALAELEVAQKLTEETGERYSLALGRSVLALIALHRGEVRLAEDEAGAADRELASGPRFRAHWASWVRALVLEAGGATEEASATLAACWDRCARAGFAIDYPVLGPDLVRLALAAGDLRRAERVAAAVAEVATANDVASLTGAALRCRGLLERDPEALRAAVDAYAASPRVLEPALAAEDAGAAAAAHGDAAAAVPPLERALAGYERLDATRDLARAEARLRDLGVRRGRRGARRRPSTGWDSLTPTERRVVDLVAEGLSNPQIGERLFVSRRTVQTHLAHVFAKLGTSSRAQLAAAAAGRRAAAPGAR